MGWGIRILLAALRPSFAVQQSSSPFGVKVTAAPLATFAVSGAYSGSLDIVYLGCRLHMKYTCSDISCVFVFRVSAW